MKRLTAEELLNLSYGDRVYRVKGGVVMPFRYVGRMPSSPVRYLIFSEGEMLTHLYINESGEFKDIWLAGDYDDNVINALEIEYLEKRLKILKENLQN